MCMRFLSGSILIARNFSPLIVAAVAPPPSIFFSGTISLKLNEFPKKTYFVCYLADTLKLADAHRLPEEASKIPPRQIPSDPTKPLKNLNKKNSFAIFLLNIIKISYFGPAT